MEGEKGRKGKATKVELGKGLHGSWLIKYLGLKVGKEMTKKDMKGSK